MGNLQEAIVKEPSLRTMNGILLFSCQSTTLWTDPGRVHGREDEQEQIRLNLNQSSIESRLSASVDGNENPLGPASSPFCTVRQVPLRAMGGGFVILTPANTLS